MLAADRTGGEARLLMGRKQMVSFFGEKNKEQSGGNNGPNM